MPGLLCVHAHPDDESIATGGVLARAADEGRDAHVITCTGGERGEVLGEGMDVAAIAPILADVRREELSAALHILGAGPPRYLGYRDSGMLPPTGPGRILPAAPEDPETFWNANLDEAVGRLVAHIRELRPQVLVTYDALGGYGHPDHVQTHRVGVLAAEAAAWAALYPSAGAPWRVPKVYLTSFPRSMIATANAELPARGLPSPFGEETDPERIDVGVPDHLVTAAVDVRPWLGRKQEALRAHRSQLGPDSFFLNMPPELTELAFGTEWFVRVRCDVEAPAREDDLFAGV